MNAHCPYVTFLISRAWRLLPVFLICSLISWAVVWRVSGFEQLKDKTCLEMFSSIFIIGYSMIPIKPNMPAWSLDIEMQFYIISPIIIFLITNNARALFVVTLLSATAALLHLSGTALPYLVFFAIGVVSASHEWAPNARFASLSLLATIMFVLICVSSPLSSIILGGAHPGPYHSYNEAACVIVGCLMAPFALWTVRNKGGTLDSLYGDISFIVYMIHWPVLKFFNTGGISVLDKLMQISGALAVVLALTLLIWFCVDRPMNKLRRKWVAQRLEARSEASLQFASR